MNSRASRLMFGERVRPALCGWLSSVIAWRSGMRNSSFIRLSVDCQSSRLRFGPISKVAARSGMP
jgi:hypothetical protein